jgi:hypothetical protein
MLEIFSIHLQNLFVIAKDIVELTHRITVLCCGSTNPTLYLGKRECGHGDVIGGKSNHFMRYELSSYSKYQNS